MNANQPVDARALGAVSLDPDYRLDLRGEPCPYPLMHTLEALSGLPEGQIVEVLADCPQAFRAVPEEAVRHGHELLQAPLREGPSMTFLFKTAKQA